MTSFLFRPNMKFNDCRECSTNTTKEELAAYQFRSNSLRKHLKAVARLYIFELHPVQLARSYVWPLCPKIGGL